MNMNMVKASAMKLPNVNPPSNSIVVIPIPVELRLYRSMQAQRTAAVRPLIARTDGGWRGIAHAGLSRLQPARGNELIRRVISTSSG
jgi:hypothetical protein